MGADRKKYVMSVEMAMQREMAFRKKLENPKAEECSNSSVIIPQRNPLHSQVQSSTLTQIPTALTPGLNQTALTPGLNQIPCRPTQVTIPNPRPAPLTGPTSAQAPPHMPNPPYPGVSRPAHVPSYRPNSPHPGITRPPRPAYQAHQHRKPPIHCQAKRVKVHSPEDFYCEVCKVDCTSEINFRMHLKGNKHKTILRNLQANKVLGGTTMSEANDKQLFCELCKIWCTDTNAFTLHLNGKNHFLKLHASEMKLKGPVGSTSMS
ncbi:uncharacterized protein LOC141601205 [Silene latifolia]|uniref:uncharacterized protein LOC141601205 n=1 Tax=Silene latifolia TaxID=37657 RepID=UPI003D77A99D